MEYRRSRTSGTTRYLGDHAVVVGASVSGLIAARVLSDRFARVRVVDRDSLPDEITARRGVPQGRHGHGLLASGFAALQSVFPGLERELVDAGALPGDVIGDIRWFQHGYYKAEFDSGFRGILLSRPLLEGVMRRQVERLHNVTIRTDTHVAGLVMDAARRRVTGVRTSTGRRELVIEEAALVVDASGRASKSPEWLAALGYSRPQLDAVDVDLGYVTRFFRRRPGDLNGDLGAIIAPIPPDHRRVGFILAQEGDRWIVTLAGWLGDHPPTDAPGFEAFARTQARPEIYELVQTAEPLTDPVAYAFPSNLRRYYERLEPVPEQFLVICDAVCSFNPFYGQGMSVAALEGLTLRKCLAAPSALDGLWKAFYKEARQIIDTPLDDRRRERLCIPGRDWQQAGRDRLRQLVSEPRALCRLDRSCSVPGLLRRRQLAEARDETLRTADRRARRDKMPDAVRPLLV